VTAKTFLPGEVLSAADVNEYLAAGYWRRIGRNIISSGSPVSSVSFSSISSGFRAFRIYWDARITGTGNLRLRLNNDSGNNYYTQRQESSGASTNSSLVGPIDGWQITLFAANHTSRGQATISKPNSGDVAFMTGESIYAAAATAPSRYNFGGGWTNVASLINRVDIVLTSGTFFGYVALEGMPGF
jgi:hypothetical protein